MSSSHSEIATKVTYCQRTHELELLDDAGRLLRLQHRARHAYAEARGRAGGREEGQHARVGGDQRAVEGAQTVHVLGRVLEESLSLVLVVSREDRDGLEPPPANLQNEQTDGTDR